MFKTLAQMSAPRFNALAIAVLAVMIMIAYGNSLENEFTNWDDEDLIVDNTHIRSLDWENIKKIFIYRLSGGTYQPVRVLSYAIDYKFWKLNPVGYHIHSILLHILASVFLYLSFLKAMPQIWKNGFEDPDPEGLRFRYFQIAAFLTALVFAVHPVNVEAVTWLASRKYGLLGMFSFLSFYFFVLGAAPDNFKVRYNLLSILCSVAAAFSSPFGVVLPVLFFLFLYCREKSHNPFYVVWKNIKSLCVYLISGTVVFLMLWIRLVGSSDGAKTFHFHGDFTYTLVAIGQVIFDYARNMICPLWLNNRYVDYTYLSFFDTYKISAGFILVLLLTAWVVHTWRRQDKFPLFCFGWLFISWLPVSNVIPISTNMADRYIYIASAGIFLYFASVGVRMACHGTAEVPFFRTNAFVKRFCGRAGIFLTMAIIVCLTGLSIQRNMVWKNSGTLFSDSIKKDPENFLAFTNLGTYLQKNGKVDKAIECYIQANKIAPDRILPLENLGYAFTSKGQYKEAISVFDHMLKIDPDLLIAHTMLGELYFLEGNNEKSAFHYSKVLESDNSNGAAITLRGNALLNMGKIDEAIALFQRGLDVYPDFPELVYNLGIAYARVKSMNSAIQAFEKTIDLQPSFAEAYNELGMIMEQKGQMDKARSLYEKGIRENAGLPEIYNNLGNVIFAKGLLDQAADNYEKALDIDSTLINARYNLCMVKEKKGYPDEAAACLLKLSEKWPDHIETLMQLGMIQEQKKATGQAEGYYRRAVELNPAGLEPYARLSRLLEKKGDIQGAINVYEKFILASSDKRLLRKTGFALNSLGGADQAVKAFEKLTRLKDASGDDFYNLGVLYAKTGENKKAYLAFKKAIQVEPGNQNAKNVLDRIIIEKNGSP